MQAFQFDRKLTGLFDEQHLSLVYEQEKVLSFINRTFSKDNVLEQAIEKGESFSNEKRTILKTALEQQYQNLSLTAAQRKNLDALSNSNAFTITTGHQLSLFTGPLYFMIKILHVIKQCEELNAENTEYNFVPMFWMATEDHDFEEVQSTNLFNNKITWDSDQKGPVGRFKIDDLQEAKEQFKSFFRDENSELFQLIHSIEATNYTDFVRQFIHGVFKDYGLLIIDGDDKLLKAQFADIVRKDLKESFSLHAVEKTNKTLKNEGYKVQAKAREVNFFYIKDGLRERIKHKNDHFHIKHVGDFSLEELLKLVDESPESFSPNVILRPLYQETILPNLLYVGGAGEISYWLQLKGVFDSVGETYPLIQVRNSVLWIDKGTSKKIEKLELRLESLFDSIDEVKREVVHQNEGDALDFSALDEQSNSLRQQLIETVLNIDNQMKSFAEAESKKIEKQIDQIKSRMIRSSKQKHENDMNAIDFIYNRLFPNGGLQERSTNFFNFCGDGDIQSKLQILHSVLNPFDGDFIIIREV